MLPAIRLLLSSESGSFQPSALPRAGHFYHPKGPFLVPLFGLVGLSDPAFLPLRHTPLLFFYGRARPLLKVCSRVLNK